MAMMTMILAAAICLQDAPADKVDQLIRDLAADEYKTREAADQELRKIGADAVPALQEAARDPDPERARRAQRIIEAIDEAARPAPPAVQPGTQVRIQMRIVMNGIAGATSFEIRGDGHVKATVQEKNEDTGKDVTRTYEADSMDKFREKYPEVAGKFQLGLSLPRIDLQVVPPAAAPDGFGIETGAVSEALADQMQLKPGEGVVVKAVAPGSRAAEAGLLQYDLILSVNGRTDGNLAALMGESLKEGFALDVLRGGEHQTIRVKPEPK